MSSEQIEGEFPDDQDALARLEERHVKDDENLAAFLDTKAGKETLANIRNTERTQFCFGPLMAGDGSFHG